MVPREILQWVNRNYPKPTVDPEWLEQCYNYLVSELHIAPNDTRTLTDNIEAQLLQSDLHDSMLARTGLPDDPASLHAVNLPPFLLLQVVSIMEIGHSAFSLQNTRQAWTEKADLAGLAGGDDDTDEPAGEYPKYPRGMLSFELSDGYNAIKAIEYRRLDSIKLGETPLGYKIVLKNVPVRRGVAMLQPSNVNLLGYSNEELDAQREAVFTRGLQERMGHSANGGQGSNPAAETPPVPEEQPPQRPPRTRNQPTARQRAHAARTAPARAAPDDNISPYFSDASDAYGGPSVQLPTLPSRSRLQDHPPTDDTIDFDDDMDESFLRQVELVERQATSQSTASHPRPSASGDGDVIAISDSEEEDKENIPLPQRKRRRQEPIEVIELSD